MADTKTTSIQPSSAGGNGGPPEKSGKPIGRSGTVNTRGFIQDREANRLLRWPLNLREFEEMQRTDPTVRWMLALLTTPIRAALWDLEPPDNPNDVELEATAFAKHAVFNELDGGWDEHLRQALTYFAMGHSVFEGVGDLREVEFDVDPLDDEGEPRHISREAIVFSQLAPRLQRTIYEWKVRDDDSSKLDKIVQRLLDGRNPNTCTIDANRLVVYIHEREGDDFRGMSVLRSAWKPWFTKAELQNIEAIAFERSAGIPIVYPPADAGEDDLDAVEEAVKKLRQGENVYLVMPGPKQFPSRGQNVGAGNEWLVEDLAVDAAAGMSAEFSAAISRYDTEMARNVMASFMQLGMQEVGSRATADVQQDPYYQAIEAHVSYIEDTFSESVIRPLCDWNYELERYPRLVASKIQAKNIQVVAAAIASLVTAGAIDPDKPLKAYLRDLVDAPEPDPDFEEEQKEKMAEAAEAAAALAKEEEADKPPPPAGGDKPPVAPKPGGGRFSLRRRRRLAAKRGETFAQFVPRRPLVGPEKHVAWGQVVGTLDNAGLDVIAIAERVMGGQIDSLTSTADAAVEQSNVPEIEALRLDPRPLTEALDAELHRIYATGQADVRAEVRRQEDEREANGLQPVGMKQEGEPPDIPLSRAETAAIIAALAKQLAQSGSDAAVGAIKRRALKALAQRSKTDAAPGENPLAELRAALRKQGPLAVNRIYSLGRMDEIKAMHQRGMIEVVVRSAVIDSNTCATCETEDGAIFRPEAAPPLPDPYCDGGDLCRCIYVPDIAPPADTTLP